ncbi:MULTISPECIES: hypothetical protein [unclassified Streptomyces]|uniref:hypothetical protein n=1 Tax=unclassified Streptomyces TaxID=2593676 RepID=UPI003803ABD9
MSDFENRPNISLSPAAQVALDEIVRDIRDELTWRAATIADKGGSQSITVSVLDVAAAVEQSSSGEKMLRRRMRLLFTAMSIYGVIGIILIVIHLALNGREPGPLLIIAGVSVGVAIPGITNWILGAILGGKWKPGARSDKASASDVYDFMRLWISIESAIRATYSEEFGESRASIPVVSMLGKLESARLISSSVSGKLNELRTLRNEIVHTEEPAFTSEKVNALSREGRAILAQLSRGVNPPRHGSAS